MAETIETSSKTLICIFDNDNCRFEFVSPVHAETHSPLVPGEFVKEEFLLAVNFMYRITLSGKKS